MALLGDSFLSPRVVIAGFSTVGECCNIGINTTIIDNVSICHNVQTGGGTVVLKNVKTSGLYVGNPGRFVRYLSNRTKNINEKTIFPKS